MPALAPQPAIVRKVEQGVSRATFDEVMMPTYAPAEFVPVRGLGSRMWDQAGRDYVDFASGVAVLALGHSHPLLLAALNTQSQKCWHVSNWMTNEPALRLASKLIAATFAERVFLCNSGTEANEGALKTARKYASTHFGEQKFGIVSTQNSFHGRSWLAVSTGGSPKYTAGMGPVAPGITHIAYNDAAALRAAVNDSTACVIIEPTQGEGGLYKATDEFLKTAREVCNKHNALLIFDEIQSGMGRTGALFSYMQRGVTPDILTSAKGLGGGFPIGAFITTAKIASVMQPGTHGTTYGGNPLGCAVAEAVLDFVNTPEVLNGVIAKTQRMRDGLAAINQRLNVFSDIRGDGLWIGCELKPELAKRGRDSVTAGHKHGVIILTAGGGEVLRIVPSLVIPDADIDEGLNRLEAALRDVISHS